MKWKCLSVVSGNPEKHWKAPGPSGNLCVVTREKPASPCLGKQHLSGLSLPQGSSIQNEKGTEAIEHHIDGGLRVN